MTFAKQLPRKKPKKKESKMKIIINQTAAALDPSATTENPEQSLANYVAELTREILKEYPESDVEHNEIDDTYAFTVSDDPDGSIAAEIQEISEAVYETGNFWA
jgi:hypothetical protein